MSSSYGQLTNEQLAVLIQYTKGKVVHDLGAGSLELARIVRSGHRRGRRTGGACKVIAIDKERISPPSDPCIEVVWTLFKDYKEPIDIALVSWPQNVPDAGLLDLIERSRIIIYLGKNTDGMMCGWPGLFWSFLSRALLAYVPDRKNVLAVYGHELTALRRPTGEELAGLTTYEKLYSYEDAEAEAAPG